MSRGLVQIDEMNCQRMESIHYINEKAKSIPRLTDEEFKECIAQIQLGDPSAKERLTLANLRLVLWVVSKYQVSNDELLADLFQEGYLGLARAVDHFDAEKGFSFSTYAVYWIFNYIEKFIKMQYNMVSMPYYVTGILKEIRSGYEQLTLKLGRVPTEQELAKNCDIPNERLKQLAPYLEKELSLDTTYVGEGEDTCIGMVIADDGPDVFDSIEKADLHDQIEQALKYLPEKYAYIIRQRYFSDGKRLKPLEEIGAELGITRERVRQLEVKSLRLLQRQRSLNSFLYD